MWRECACVCIWLRSKHTKLLNVYYSENNGILPKDVCSICEVLWESRCGCDSYRNGVGPRSSTHSMFERSHSLMITNEWKSWRQCHIDYSALTAKWALLISTILPKYTNIFVLCMNYQFIDLWWWAGRVDAEFTRFSWLTRDLRVEWHSTMSWKWEMRKWRENRNVIPAKERKKFIDFGSITYYYRTVTLARPCTWRAHIKHSQSSVVTMTMCVYWHKFRMNFCSEARISNSK